MNNKVKFLRGTATEYEASTKDNDTFYYTTDDEKLYLGNKEITGGGVTIDDTLSDTSKNPVQNKVITNALNTKANLTDIPTTLPADGGNADTLDGLHETSFSRERGDISDCNSAVLPGTYNAIPETINTPYSSYWLVTVDIGASGTWIRQTATHCNTTVPTETYHRLFINDAWNSWTKINGNADIAKKVETASQKALLWEDSEGGNLRLESPDSNHSVEMDLYNNSFRMVFADNGELAFPVDYNSTTKKFNINGNADTVDGKHASDFVQNLTIWKGVSVKNQLIKTTQSGFVWIDNTCTDLPDGTTTWWYGIVIHTVSHYQLIITDISNVATYVLSYNAGTTPPRFYDWRNLSDGGNATTVNGLTVQTAVPANAKFTDTTYSPGTGISISGTTISNSGVHSVATGGSNGTISVNTNGTAANVAVKGLASAAYQAVQTAAGTVGLHRISSGTAAATTNNCPAGCWYGQYE